MRTVPDHFIYTSDDVLRMLDALLAGRGGVQWNEFFADRAKPCPFFVEWPDENLVAWFSEGLLTPGRVARAGMRTRAERYLPGKPGMRRRCR